MTNGKFLVPGSWFLVPVRAGSGSELCRTAWYRTFAVARVVGMEGIAPSMLENGE